MQAQDVGAAPAADPYPHIKSMIERELSHVRELERAIFMGRPDAVDALQDAMHGVKDQLDVLQSAVAAMVAQPAKFGLSSDMAYHRQVEVENLLYELSDVRRATDQVHASSSGAKPKYTTVELSADAHYARGLGLSTGAVARGDPTVADHQERVQQMVQQQDQDLEEISLRVDNIKRTGAVMHEELAEQEQLLGGFTEDVDTQTLKLRGLRHRVADILKRSGQDKQLMAIIFLSVLLVILFVLAIA